MRQVQLTVRSGHEPKIFRFVFVKKVVALVGEKRARDGTLEPLSIVALNVKATVQLSPAAGAAARSTDAQTHHHLMQTTVTYDKKKSLGNAALTNQRLNKTACRFCAIN